MERHGEVNGNRSEVVKSLVSVSVIRYNKNMARLTKEDIKNVNNYRNLFPREIVVRILRSEDGGFAAEIMEFPRCYTEADTFAELIEMVNDAMMTYFEIPDKYTSYMSTYLPTIETAQKFNAFPVFKTEEELKLKLPSRETVKN